jgi:hypothetical protein
LRLGTGDPNPHFFLWPAHLLLYLAFLSYGAWFAVGRVAGWWRDAAGFAASYFRDPSAFYLIARLHSVAFGVWTVGLAYAIGRRGYSGAVGIAAALALAVNALHGHYSHLAHPVTGMTAFTALGLWACLRAANEGRPRHLLVAGLAMGLGTATQYHAALLAVPIGIAALQRARDGGQVRRWLGTGAAALGLGGAVFLLLCPFVVLDFETFRADLSWIGTKAAGGLSGQTVGPLEGLVRFVMGGMVPALGWPGALAGLAGMVLALWRRTRADILLLGFLAAYVLFASRAGSLNDRYALPALVPALVLVARAVADGVAALRLRPATWVTAAATLALSLPEAMELVESNVTMTRDDTRVAALRWFESRVPAGEKVVIDMLKFWNTASPPLSENRASILRRIETIERGVSGGGHGAAYLEYYRYRLAHPRRPDYDLEGTDMGTAARPLEDYLRRGFGWAVVSSDAADAQRAAAAGGDSASWVRYYRALERSGPPVAEFRPERWTRRGPTIRIYRLGRS